MGNITLAVPDDVHDLMRKHTDIRWSDVARRAIIDRIEALEVVERIAKKSKLTEKDVEEISRKIKKDSVKAFRA